MHAHARGAPGAGLSVHIDATAESRGAAGHRLPRPLARGCGRGAARASGPLARQGRRGASESACQTSTASSKVLDTAAFGVGGTPRSDLTKARARAVGPDGTGVVREGCAGKLYLLPLCGCGPGRGERTPARGMEQWSCSCMPASRARASSRAGCVPCPSLDGGTRRVRTAWSVETRPTR